ncbi:MAG: CYTH domain-containing protein, partial [Spirochaetaceae bacterium]|nr:CYTH domain-containing protein [Spirochaetaceae bacterium]
MKNTYLEIERKYLIEHCPLDLSEYKKVKIQQAYLSLPKELNTLRVRNYGGEYLITIKQQSETGKLLRREVELPIKKAPFKELWDMAGQRSISKTRYLIPWNNKTIELDIFEEKLKGLVVAEIEFSNEEESINFPIPPWFGKELTEDYRY